MEDSRKRNEHGALCTYKQIAEESNLGLNTVMRLARESGSLIKIGRIARVDPETFFQYVRESYRVKGG